MALWSRDFPRSTPIVIGPAAVEESTRVTGLDRLHPGSTRRHHPAPVAVPPGLGRRTSRTPPEVVAAQPFWRESRRLIAPAGVDPPTVVADTPGDIGRRRWVIWHWSVVSRRRHVGSDYIGDVGAPTYRNAPACTGAHVGVRDSWGVNDDDSPRDGREGQDRRGCSFTCPCPTHPGPLLSAIT